MKKQFLRFTVVGPLSTAVNYLVFFLALHHLAINYLISSAFQKITKIGSLIEEQS